MHNKSISIERKIEHRIIMTERESDHQRFQKDNGIKRILVVDDEYDVSLTIKAVLEENGFKVDSFTNAFQALKF
jgi:PleD family two-component response regulator